MIIFLWKQIASVKQAIVGRNEPAQLAWGLALGVLLGVVPHGNLLAVILLVILLSLRVNHGIAALATVATTFIATRLDPYAHEIGRMVLTSDRVGPRMATIWQMPFVPWTDLNNTVVMGSTLIGLALLVPIFLLTYPVFHLLAPKNTTINTDPTKIPSFATGTMETVGMAAALRDADPSGYPRESKPSAEPLPRPQTSVAARPLEPSAIDAAMSGIEGGAKTNRGGEEPQLIETRIDVIRIGNRTEGDASGLVEASDVAKQDEPMSEALRYLLRQVREANRRSAA